VRFSPNPQNPVIVSAGWDKLVKVRTTKETLCKTAPLPFYDDLDFLKYLLLQSFGYETTTPFPDTQPNS
jgi:hypothetical protein